MLRHYVFADSGTLTEVSHEDSAQIAGGEKLLPEYAGARLRYMQVMVVDSETEDAKRVEVRMAGAIVCFDEHGRLVQTEALDADEDSFTPFERETCAQLALAERDEFRSTVH